MNGNPGSRSSGTLSRTPTEYTCTGAAGPGRGAHLWGRKGPESKRVDATGFVHALSWMDERPKVDRAVVHVRRKRCAARSRLSLRSRSAQPLPDGEVVAMLALMWGWALGAFSPWRSCRSASGVGQWFCQRLHAATASRMGRVGAEGRRPFPYRETSQRFAPGLPTLWPQSSLNSTPWPQWVSSLKAARPT